MKFSTIEIFPTKWVHGWQVRFSDLDGDREGKTYPQSMGFYHYPTSLGREHAFDSLKQKLIKEHKDAIERMTESLLRLERLQMP